MPLVVVVVLIVVEVVAVVAVVRYVDPLRIYMMNNDGDYYGVNHTNQRGPRG